MKDLGIANMLQKKYADYLEEMYKLFPDVEEGSIQHIIEWGLKKMHQYLKTGSDLLFRDFETSLFMGNSIKESPEQLVNSAVKEHEKYRRMFLDKKQPWDGYHYFGLTEEENIDFQKNKKIVTLYKIMKESAIRKGVRYIYRIDLKYDIPVNKINWAENKEVSLEDVELSQEGQKKLKYRLRRAELQLKYKEKNEEN